MTAVWIVAGLAAYLWFASTVGRALRSRQPEERR